MENVESLLRVVGESDFRTRVEILKSTGESSEAANDTVAKQMIEEIHRMLRALLLMRGVPTDGMTDAEAVHTKR